jgi:hypothetical protein
MFMISVNMCSAWGNLFYISNKDARNYDKVSLIKTTWVLDRGAMCKTLSKILTDKNYEENVFSQTQ